MMHLTTFTDHSIRLLIYLCLKQTERVTVAEIAHAYDISENHLTKVARNLAIHGYVETLRGRKGGIRLFMSPESINLGKLIRLTEKNTGLLPCVKHHGNCCLEPACRFIGVLDEAENALYKVFDQYSLASLMAKNPELVKILLPDSIINQG